MSFVDDLLVILSDYNDGYRLMRRRMGGYCGPAKFSYLKQTVDVTENTLSVTLSRLKKNGLVVNQRGIWRTTPRGLEYLKLRLEKLSQGKIINLVYKPRKRAPSSGKRNMIIAFDIPESQRIKRDWLRLELTALGFSQLQKSVWFGPAPLPGDFIKTLHKLKIISHLKFFKVAEWEVV